MSGPFPGEDDEPGERAYSAALRAVRRARSAPFSEAVAGGLLEPARSLAEALDARPTPMLLRANRSTADHFLDAHAVNVAVLCMHVSKAAGAPAEKIPELGAAALAHDLARTTGPAERSSSAALEKRLHPLAADKLFDHQLSLERVVPDPLRNIFPIKLDEDEEEHAGKRRPPHHGAQVLATCDLYETLTRARPWREPGSPHEALLGLMRLHRRASDQPLMKAFAERLSLFPVGCFVGLSDGRYGRVCEVHPGAPMRPDVGVFAGPDGKPVKPYVARLREADHLSVDRVYPGILLPLRDARQRLQVASCAWWPPGHS
ncbi:MAG TPA: hypothetical protein VNI01_10360 [Elusimicrobiota bacterium]|nr:hypothetical protein [Elusimicrobiota bacterium]